MIFKSKIAAPIIAVRTPYWKIEALRGRYLKDPYYQDELPSGYQSVDMLPHARVEQRQLTSGARDLSASAAKARPRITLAERAAFVSNNGFWFQARGMIEGTVRLLSKQRYTNDSYAAISPLDLAVAWCALLDRAMLKSISVRQADRWLFWQGWAPGLRKEDIIDSVANWHMIPSSSHILNILNSAEPGALVTLRGKLVDVTHAGICWKTSVVLGDKGDGACEIIWVDAVEVR